MPRKSKRTRMVANESAVAERVTVFNALQSVTANVKPSVRHDQMEGRDWLVAPMVMITEGVHNGTNGPLYYSPDELEKSAGVWNHKPIVVYHPTMNGRPVSACDPDVLTSRKVGVILNTRVEGGKLKADAWLEPDRLRAVDERVLAALEEGKVMEVSTGLFTDIDGVAGTWNNEDYTGTVSNFRPDHLALLPDKKGACSVMDGAGLLQNAALDPAMSDAEIAMVLAMRRIDNASSHQDIEAAIRTELSDTATNPVGMPAAAVYVVEVFDKHFIYEDDGKMYSASYTFDKKTKTASVDLAGRKEVRRVVSYTGTDGKRVTHNKEQAMDKEQVVEDLISNANTDWDEDDRDALLAFDEAHLTKIAAGVQNAEKSEDKDEPEDKDESEDKDEPVENEDGNEEPPQTVEEFIANAPEGMRDMLEAGVRAHKAQRQRIVTVITANKANTFTKEQLATKSIGELEKIAALATAGAKPAVYDGMAEPADITGNEEEEPLTPPAMTFD